MDLPLSDKAAVTRAEKLRDKQAFVSNGVPVGSVAARHTALLWAGMVLGVSFLATPVKFLAPSLALLPALDVGRQTFFALNRVELALGLTLAVLGWRSSVPRLGRKLAWVMPWLLVLLQGAWLLPLLDARVEQMLAGGVPPPSQLHQVYIGVELVKLVWLLGLGLFTRSSTAPAACVVEVSDH